MTDKEKLEEIRAEIEKLKSQLLRGACSSQIAMETRCKEEAYDEVLAILDSLQEEPVSDDLEEAGKQYLERSNPDRVHQITNAFKAGAKWQKQKDSIVSEDLEKASKEWLAPQLDKSYANYGEAKMMELTHFDGYAMLDAIEFGAKWQKAKKESVTKDLGEYINELSKQFPEVSFAKLSRIAVRVSKWKREQIEEALLSEVLPCFMHGGEADEVVAKLDDVLNKKK